MKALEARAQILTPFVTVWTTNSYEARYADVPDAPPDDDVVWARVVVKHINNPQTTLSNATGKRKFTAFGLLTLQLFAPIADAMKTAYTVGQQVVDSYSTQTEGLVWFRNARMNEIGPSGGFQQVNVLVDFQYNDVR